MGQLRPAGWVVIGLAVWFVAAVIAVDRSGNCWQNCDNETFVVYDARPLGYWLAGLGASVCAALWSRAYRRDASCRQMLAWGVPAVFASGYWAAGVRQLL